jgi:DNA-binding beta-propeller fold protein YncE
MNRFGTVATLAFVLVAGACSAPGKPGASPQAAKPTAPAGRVDLLVLRDGDNSGEAPYAVVDGSDGRVLLRLPAGVPASDWHVLYSSRLSGASTIVRAIDPVGGSVQREMSVKGAWQLPSIGLARLPGGLSADGRTLVLEATTAAVSGTSATTRFAIVPTEGNGAPRVITLAGRFTFDALSPDGTLLYVIEHLTPSDYLVRQVDVTTGQLAAGAILDKRNVDERMSGYAATQLPGADGWVYTVYRGEDGDFIHALDTQHGVALCIDLPGTEGADEASAAHWGLALDATGRVLYAANSALGTVSEVSLDGFSIRTKALPTAGRGVVLAKFATGQAPSGGRVAASPDGSTLYVLGERGVISVATSNLTPTDRFGGDRTYRSLALSAAGSLYVVDEAGTVARLDSADGHITATLDRHAFADIVAVLATR